MTKFVYLQDGEAMRIDLTGVAFSNGSEAMYSVEGKESNSCNVKHIAVIEGLKPASTFADVYIKMFSDIKEIRLINVKTGELVLKIETNIKVNYVTTFY